MIDRAEFIGLMAAAVAAAAVPALAQSGPAKPVKSLDEFYEVWQQRFNAGDLEGLVDLYVDDVTFINPEGKQLQGKDAVRRDFEGLLAAKPKIDIHDRRHVVYGDTALTTNHWRITLPGADGKTQELTGGGIEVVRRQSDGGWRYIIDDASRSPNP